jgi:hypothetical protein
MPGKPRSVRQLSFSLMLAALLLALPVTGRLAAAEETQADDRAAVVQVVTDAYVDGVHNFRDPAAMRRGFHPDFEMLSLRDGRLARLTLANWIEGMEARNLKEPPPKSAPEAPRETTAKFVTVEITGTAATCKLELWRGGKQIFTDFLALYKFADGWKIVSKTFYRHA